MNKIIAISEFLPAASIVDNKDIFAKSNKDKYWKEIQEVVQIKVLIFLIE